MMPPTALESPLLKALLRGLTLVAATEAVFFRLMPDPPRQAGRPVARLLAHAADAGQVAFIIALTIVTVALLGAALTSLRRNVWPPFRNGLVAACMLGLAAQGVSLLTSRPGAATAIAFTALSLLTYMLVATHAYARSGSLWARAFMIAYGAAMMVSAAGGVVQLATTGPVARRSAALATLVDLVPHAFQAGAVLAAAAASFAFLAFGENAKPSGAAGSLRWPILALCVSLAASFAAGCLLAPPDASILGAEPDVVQVLALTCALFLGLLTAAGNLIPPESRTRGYGLLLMVMAGYPLGIAYEHMLMVLGSALLLSPDATGRAGAVRLSSASGPEGPGLEPLGAVGSPSPHLAGD